jgi:hypothetical protein
VLRFFHKTPTRLYLGSLTVLPRKDFKRHFEGGFMGGATLDNALNQRLLNIFALPKATDAAAITEGDIAVDVVLESYSRGGLADFSSPTLNFPLFWRPKVRLGARLYYLKTGNERAKLHVTHRIAWGEYIASLLSWKVYLGIASPTSRKRLEDLLEVACLSLKRRVERSVGVAPGDA